MASDLSFVEYIADQIKDAGVISYRKMFGEYAIYSDGKLVALICDNRVFIKPTHAGKTFLGSAVTMLEPYPRAKPYLLIEHQFEDSAWFSQLVKSSASELPLPKPKKKKAK